MERLARFGADMVLNNLGSRLNALWRDSLLRMNFD